MRILNREQVVSHGFEEGRRIVPDIMELMVLFWIWEYPPISWTMRNVDLPIG